MNNTASGERRRCSHWKTALAAGVRQRYLSQVTLFEAGVPTNIGILHEAGHPEPWIIAMDCEPSRARVLDYGLRWGIEPMFSDFKSRGFGLGQTQLQQPRRLNRLLLIMALTLHGCVQTGRLDEALCPTPIEKKPVHSAPTPIGRSKKRAAANSPGLRADSEKFIAVSKPLCLSQFFAIP